MLRSIASVPPAKAKKKLLSARRRWGHRTPCWLHPRARVREKKRVNAQSQGCGEPGVVEGDPIARQRLVDVDAAVDRLRPASESQKEIAVGAAPVGPSHALLAPSSRAREGEEAGQRAVPGLRRTGCCRRRPHSSTAAGRRRCCGRSPPPPPPPAKAKTKKLSARRRWAIARPAGSILARA